LKTAGSAQPIPIPRELALLLAASVQAYPSEMMVTNMRGTEGAGPQIIGRAMRDAREKVAGLPEGFSFHDLRHYLASLLIASGLASVAGRRRVHPLSGWRRHLGTDELSRSYCGPTADPLTTRPCLCWSAR
jgi:integrase